MEQEIFNIGDAVISTIYRGSIMEVCSIEVYDKSAFNQVFAYKCKWLGLYGNTFTAVLPGNEITKFQEESHRRYATVHQKISNY